MCTRSAWLGTRGIGSLATPTVAPTAWRTPVRYKRPTRRPALAPAPFVLGGSDMRTPTIRVRPEGLYGGNPEMKAIVGPAIGVGPGNRRPSPAAIRPMRLVASLSLSPSATLTPSTISQADTHSFCAAL
jgi:hypothetical protein